MGKSGVLPYEKYRAEMENGLSRNIIKVIYILSAVVLLIAAGGMWRAEHALAASASISVTAESNKVAKGDNVYVIITVRSADLIGGFKGTFTYDSSVLKYITGGSVMSGNDDEFYLTDTDRDTGVKKIKYVVKFKARQKGSVSIHLKKPYSVYSSDDSSEMSVAFNSLNIMVVDKKELEENAKKAEEQKAEQEYRTVDKNEQGDNEQNDKDKAKDPSGLDKSSDNIIQDNKGDMNNSDINSSISGTSDTGTSDMSISDTNVSGTDKRQTSDTMKYIVISGIIILAVLIIIFTCIISHTYRKYDEEFYDEDEDEDDIDDLPSGNSWKR